jgi:beta-N-acetylhexosaminidase
MSREPPPFEAVTAPTLVLLGDSSYVPYGHLLPAHREAAGDRLEVRTIAGGHTLLWDAAEETISAVEHFPGHNVSTDSHKDLPVLDSDRSRLRSHDLKPFEAAVADAAPGIMTGHLDVTAIDKGVPASMSRKVITTGLRKNLGFDGLVISDSLGMGAVMQRYPGGDSTVEAIKAGSDLALMPADNDQAYDAVLAALKSGEIPEQQARDSAARTMRDAAPGSPASTSTHSSSRPSDDAMNATFTIRSLR